jgi:hypothetical protein
MNISLYEPFQSLNQSLIHILTARNDRYHIASLVCRKLCVLTIYHHPTSYLKAMIGNWQNADLALGKLWIPHCDLRIASVGSLRLELG